MRTTALLTTLLATAAVATPSHHQGAGFGHVSEARQGYPTGNGTCQTDPYKPEDPTLNCMWGAMVAMFPCDRGTECTAEGSPCWAEKLAGKWSTSYVKCT